MMEKNHVDSKYYPLLSVVRQRLAGSEKLRVKEFCKNFKDVVKFLDIDNNRLCVRFICLKENN